MEREYLQQADDFTAEQYEEMLELIFDNVEADGTFEVAWYDWARSIGVRLSGWIKRKEFLSSNGETTVEETIHLDYYDVREEPETHMRFCQWPSTDRYAFDPKKIDGDCEISHR